MQLVKVYWKTKRINTIKPQYPNTNSPQYSVHALRYRISWENLIKDQSISFVFIILLILLTFSIDDVLI